MYQVPTLIRSPSSPFEPPTTLYRLVTAPLHFLLQHIHSLLVIFRGRPFTPLHSPLRVVCISDTHTHLPALPSGDLLIHAGDMTNKGTTKEIQAQLDWLSSQPFSNIVAIAGNHDSYFDPGSRCKEDAGNKLDFGRVTYLQHSGATLTFPSKPGEGDGDRKVTIYGAPQIPKCGGREHAFQYEPEDDAWSGSLPSDVEILVTHTPPKWHLDLPTGLGCEFLLREVWRVKPRLHVFGHVHGGRGKETVFWGKAQEAWERVAARRSIWDWVWAGAWIDAVKVLTRGLLGVVWARIWGAEQDATIMVNSGVVDWRNRLVHKPQIVEI